MVKKVHRKPTLDISKHLNKINLQITKPQGFSDYILHRKRLMPETETVSSPLSTN
jgi:hypothetical protein